MTKLNHGFNYSWGSDEPINTDDSTFDKCINMSCKKTVSSIILKVKHSRPKGKEALRMKIAKPETLPVKQKCNDCLSYSPAKIKKSTCMAIQKRNPELNRKLKMQSNSQLRISLT